MSSLLGRLDSAQRRDLALGEGRLSQRNGTRSHRLLLHQPIKRVRALSPNRFPHHLSTRLIINRNPALVPKPTDPAAAQLIQRHNVAAGSRLVRDVFQHQLLAAVERQLHWSVPVA